MTERYGRGRSIRRNPGHAGETGGTARNFARLTEWIENTPASELDRRQKAAEAAFRQLGITFAVYGEEESAERIIPFDIVPRIFTARE